MTNFVIFFCHRLFYISLTVMSKADSAYFGLKGMPVPLSSVIYEIRKIEILRRNAYLNEENFMC